MALPQTQVPITAFKKAREAGKTVKELAKEFKISESDTKRIIATLNLPKRAKNKPRFVLIDDSIPTYHSEHDNQSQIAH